MRQLRGPNGQSLYLAERPSEVGLENLARRSARLQNQIDWGQRSIETANQPFRPPGSTGQSIAPDGSVTTYYGPDGSRTVSPSGRVTTQSGATPSPLRGATVNSPTARTPQMLRQPAAYKPAAVVEAAPRPPVRAPRFSVPKGIQRLPKPPGGAGAVAGGTLSVVGGVISGVQTAMNGGTLGQSIGTGVGVAAGGLAGSIGGALVGKAVGGPTGALAGGVAGGELGGAIGGAIGGYLGGVIDPPADIPAGAVTGPLGSTIPLNFSEPYDATGINGVSILLQRPWDGSVSGFNVLGIEENGTTGPGWSALKLTTCQGTVYFKEAYVEGSIQFVSSGVCGATPGPPPPQGQPAHPARVPAGVTPLLTNPVDLADGITPPSMPAPVPGPAAAPSAPTTPQPNKLPPPALRPPPENGAKPLPPPNDRPTSAPSESPNSVPGLRPQTRGFNGGQTVPRTNPNTGEEELAQLSPQRQAELDPLKNGQLQSFEDRYVPFEDRYVPFSEKIAEHDELMPDFLPLPIGVPAGAPRAGNVAKPKGAPATALKQRPGGTTGTQVQAPPPKKTPPPTKTGSGCGCNAPILKKLNQISGPANLVAEGASLAKILEKLNTMQQFAEKAWRATRIQKVLDVLTFVGVMHNVALLSRDVGETFGWVAGQALNVVGIEDEEGNTIDVYGWFTNGIETLLRGMLGDELYEDGRETWLKASAIVRSASMIIWTMRGIMDATQDLMEWTAENTGRIGNALKRFGVVGERAFPWMSERAQARNRVRARFDKVTGTLENAEDMASSFSMATGNVLEIQQETGELGQQFSDFRDTVTDALPDPWDDNEPVATSAATEAENAQSPDIQSSDTARGN